MWDGVMLSLQLGEEMEFTKAPLRGYVHAGHLVPLELGLHPLKDTNMSTKAIVCTKTLVLAASNVHLQV
jgi:hypothetical protein